MGIRLQNPEQTVKRTVLKPIYVTGISSTSSYIAGRVSMIRIELDKAQSVSAINVHNYTTIAGNVTVGIYAEGATNTPVGGTVLVQSASIAHAGANTLQSFPITATFLPAGAYYVALEVSDATATIGTITATNFSVGQSFYYDRGGGYGALTDPCPASTATSTNMPSMVLISP